MIRHSQGKIFWRGSIRPFLLHPRAAMLSILSIALGVAVFLAITIANRGAVESFHRAFAMITGNADLEIRGHVPETILPEVNNITGVKAATPLVEAMVTLPDYPGESLHLVGLDPFTAAGLLSLTPFFGSHAQTTKGEEGGDLVEWLGDESGIAVLRVFAERHDLKQGDPIRLQGGGPSRRLHMRHIIRTDDASAEGRGGVAALDLATAQEWVGELGYLSAILIKLRSPSEKQAVIALLQRLVPADVTVQSPARRTQLVDIMLAAFRLNLTALSLVSLMVGMFFVGNSAAASVVRRRVSLGILRALGASRPMILAMVLVEAALSGLIGSLIGILVSPLIAGILAAPVAQTVTALYLPVDAHGGWPSPLEAVAGMVAGVLAALVAAWIPARQAASVDPTKVLHPGTAPEIFPMPALPLALCGVGVLLLGFFCSLGALFGGVALLGFGAAFFVLAGFSLMVPMVAVVAAGLLRRLLARPLLARGAILRIALEQTMRSLHRTAPTIAALAAAAAMTVGISVMIHSFRGSVIAWTGRTLTADLFIAPAANELLGLEHTMPETAAAWWRKQAAVSAVGTFREVEARSVEGAQVTLGVVSGPARGSIDFLHGHGAEKTRVLERGEGVALSESLGRRLKLGPGDKLVLSAPNGPLTLPVIDLYRDYTRDRGIAMIGADYFAKVWGAQGVHSLAIEFTPGTPEKMRDETSAAFFSVFGGKEAFICYSNQALKTRIIEIFNQTFAVTAVLKTISIAVAIGGVMLTLGILVMERTRELGVLKAIGASRGQIVRVMLAEASLIGLLASLVGILSGAALALVLTWVINKAFFGWSIDLAYPWRDIALLPLWMTAAALVAGLVPALRAATLPPASSLRME